ncbi:MAG: hypothetical protein ACI31F_04875 [Muribaculaceae bacterium]
MRIRFPGDAGLWQGDAAKSMRLSSFWLVYQSLPHLAASGKVG